MFNKIKINKLFLYRPKINYEIEIEKKPNNLNYNLLYEIFNYQFT